MGKNRSRTPFCGSPWTQENIVVKIYQQMLEMVLWAITTLHIFCRFFILKAIKIAFMVQNLRQFSWICVRINYSALWNCRNCNLTAASSQISTRQPQTHDKALGTLCAQSDTQEVARSAPTLGAVSKLAPGSCPQPDGKSGQKWTWLIGHTWTQWRTELHHNLIHHTALHCTVLWCVK